MIESGSCGGGLVSTISGCEAAAAALGLSDQTAYDYTVEYTSSTYLASYPQGCVFLSSRYLYLFGGSSSGACSSIRQCICKSTPPPWLAP